MKLTIPAKAFRELVATTNTVVSRRPDHPALGAVVFDTRTTPPLALVANSGTILRRSLGGALVEPGGIDVFGIAHQALSALVSFLDPAGHVVLAETDGRITITLLDGDTPTGTWQVDHLDAKALAVFPDEPAEAKNSTYVEWYGPGLADALDRLPSSPDHYALQVVGSQLRTASYVAAATTLLDGPRNPTDLIDLPTEARKLLRALARHDAIVLDETATWWVVRSGPWVAHLAKLASPTEDVGTLWLSSIPGVEHTARVPLDALRGAIARASVLSPYVALTIADGHLTVAASDGTTTHDVALDRAPAEPTGDAEHWYTADQLGAALASFAGPIDLTLPGASHPFAYLADTWTTVAIAPIRAVAA